MVRRLFASPLFNTSTLRASMKKESRHTDSGGANMNKRDQNEGLPDPRNEYLPLAQWLQQVLAITPPEPKTELTSITDNGGRFGDDYLSEFYRQLTDFVMQLIINDIPAILRFTPL